MFSKRELSLTSSHFFAISVLVPDDFFDKAVESDKQFLDYLATIVKSGGVKGLETLTTLKVRDVPQRYHSYRKTDVLNFIPMHHAVLI